MFKKYYVVRSIDLITMTVKDEVFATVEEAKEKLRKMDLMISYTDLLIEIEVEDLTLEEVKEEFELLYSKNLFDLVNDCSIGIKR